MKQSVVIRYLSGTKGSAVEQIPIAGRKELIAGRAPSCEIRYDLDGDDLVSRRHMKIEIADADAPEFTAVDLGSRNGTFINRQQIKEPRKLLPGDVVQLGAGGPEFVFDLDPRSPEKLVPKAERTAAYNVAPELIAKNEAPPKSPPVPPVALVRSSNPQPKGGKRFLAGVAALVVLGCATAVWRHNSPQAMHVTQASKFAWTSGFARTSGMAWNAVNSGRRWYVQMGTFFQRRKPEEKRVQLRKNAPAPSNAVVNFDLIARVESEWTLLDIRSGRQLRQVYIENAKADAKDGVAPLIPNAGRSLPLFVLLDDNRLQPVLTVSDDTRYRPIGGIYRNQGFLAAGGLILTSRRMAVPWSVPYEWPVDAAAGVVAKFDKRLRLVNTAMLARRQLPQWLPMESQFILADSLDAPSLRLSRKEVRLDGRAEYLTVSLGKQSQRVAAQAVRVSEHADLAVLRIHPEPASRGLQLRESADCKPGDVAIIPSLKSSVMKGPRASQWSGKVVALWREEDAQSGTRWMGDQYEIAGREEAGAQPGNPVFDEQGRVFAIETSANPLRSAGIFAIPIRYGQELLATAKN